MKPSYLVALALGGTAAPVALAHDLWLEPSAYRVAPGTPLKLRLRVGQDFKGEPMPRNGNLIEKFFLSGPEGERPAIGADGVDPAGFAKAEAPGLHTAIYFSRFSVVEMEGRKFASYLKEEGLEAIAKVRARHGESLKPARDRFLRCAKTLIQVGASNASGFDHAFGLPLELVPQASPYSPNSPLRVKVLWQGRPLKGSLVVAFCQNNPLRKIQVRSDSQGQVILPLQEDGVWLVKCVHMRLAGAGEPAADFESYWASLSFERKA